MASRCEEIVVQLIVRSYDEEGRPTGEHLLGQLNGQGALVPIKVFRNAETIDFWGWVDRQVEASEQAQKKP
jgi:hypothetical protein